MSVFHKIHMPPKPKNHHHLNHPPLPPPPPKSINYPKEKYNQLLKPYDLEISNIDLKELKAKGELLGRDFDWQLYSYNGHKYFYRFTPLEVFFVKDTKKETAQTDYIILLTIVLNLFLVSFYIFLINKLKPLKTLKSNVQMFADGDLNIKTKSKSKDEIGELANEFDNAITQIRELSHSRNLFLRNIMHELNTPITKGMLIGNLIQDHHYAENIKKIFARLDFVLKEFQQIEEITSKKMQLNKADFRVLDLVENAIDVLIAKKDTVEIELIENPVINVDFNFFSIAIKNLLDNAIKYGSSKPVVTIEYNLIKFSSQGARLPKSLSEYEMLLNKNYQTSQTGLGLGLYICHNIFKAHNFIFEHEYKDNCNMFTVKFTK